MGNAQEEEVAFAALRATLAPLGHAATEAVHSPQCAALVASYVVAARGFVDAIRRFDGSDANALEIEQAAAAYREALHLMVERVHQIALEVTGTDRPQ